MKLTLKEIFDSQFDQVKFDRKLCERIIRFSQEFMTRNSDHSAFFGGVLLGVHPIRFFDSDRETWYEEVLDIDEDLLLAEFRKAKDIDFNFNVMSDAFNYTPIYVVHRLEHVTNIPVKLKKEAQIHAFMVLHYRFLTSLLVTRFRTPADPTVAQATYNALSGRFDIKRYGSWRKLLEARCEDLTDSQSIYAKTIRDFTPDTAAPNNPGVIRVVTDTQGRIREVVKKIYAVHYDMLTSGVRVVSTTDISLNSDGEMILHDRKNAHTHYLRYIESIVPQESTFIKLELVDVVSNAMPTMPPKLFADSLRFLSHNYGQPRMGYLEETVRETLLYSFSYIHKNRALFGNNLNLPILVSRLRALFTASRSSDPTVLKLRQLTERLVKNSIKSRNQAVIASVRTGLLLYIVLRAFCKQHYS